MTQEEAKDGPVGQGDYTVREGDCMLSIAEEYGFFWETLWNNSANAELKQKRKYANVLLPGDLVTIPEKTPKQVDGATSQKHSFKRKGVPYLLRLRILKPHEPDGNEQYDNENPPGSQQHVEYKDPDPPDAQPDDPWANVEYRLVIDGATRTGQTDGDGILEAPLPPFASSGMLTIAPGTEDELQMELTLGTLDPVTTVAGAKKRLAHLGFDCGDVDNNDGAQFEQALSNFQEFAGLEATGVLDQATEEKLVELNGR